MRKQRDNGHNFLPFVVSMDVWWISDTTLSGISWPHQILYCGRQRIFMKSPPKIWLSKFLRLCKELNCNMKSRIAFNREFSERELIIGNGIKQVDILVPHCFQYFLPLVSYVSQNADRRTKIGLHTPGYTFKSWEDLLLSM